MITTTSRPKMERAVVLNALRQRNDKNFKDLGLMNPYFTIKFAYVPKHREDLVVSMFPSEMEAQDDIYLELTDGSHNPIFEQPVLYKLRRNPFYKQGEYEVIPADASRNKNSETYLVPVSELEIVAGTPTPGVLPLSVVKKPQISIGQLLNTASIDAEDRAAQKEKEDAHYSEMTIRDLAAIMLKVPVSNKRWLNDLINQTK
jgi:hypothetical protein